MNVSVEEKKTEAIARMKEIGISSQTISQFEKHDKISVSEAPFGVFSWIKDEDLEQVREFEQLYDALVFVVIRDFSPLLGTMDSFLFVSDSPEEWEFERQILKKGQTIAYVYNHDVPEYSETGTIGIELTTAGGLRRVSF
ncbi:MAG: hypothetical protein IJU98_09660 [Synergistaceae bacterium]|nr:hypothetical protein [Synergistaceae bacterium]